MPTGWRSGTSFEEIEMHSRSMCGDGDRLLSGRTSLVSFSDYLNPADGELASEPHPLRVLAVLRNNEPGQRALNCLVALGKMVPTLEVVFIFACHPRPSGLSEQAGGSGGVPRLTQQFQEMASRKLTAAGIHCKSEFGDPLQAIPRCCRMVECHAIVMTEDKPSPIDHFVLRPLGLTRLAPTLLIAEQVGVPVCIFR